MRESRWADHRSHPDIRRHTGCCWGLPVPTALGFASAPGFEPLADGRGGRDVAPFEAAQIPLMESELFGSLDLGQAQRLAVPLEACAERSRRWH